MTVVSAMAASILTRAVREIDARIISGTAFDLRLRPVTFAGTGSRLTIIRHRSPGSVFTLVAASFILPASARPE